jgi:hypothetical protein
MEEHGGDAGGRGMKRGVRVVLSMRGEVGVCCGL